MERMKKERKRKQERKMGKENVRDTEIGQSEEDFLLRIEGGRKREREREIVTRNSCQVEDENR